MPSLSQFYHILKNFNEDKWWCPTEEYFWQDCGYDVREEYDELKRLVAAKPVPRFGEGLLNKELIEHQKKADVLKQRLAILTEQERPKGTLEEEAKVLDWEKKLLAATTNDSTETYLLGQLEQIEANYRAKKADIEGKLAAVRSKKALQVASVTNHLNSARDKLDRLKNYRSNPRIKLEMELEPHQKFIHDYYAEQRAITAHAEAEAKFKVMEQQVWERKVAWFKEKSQEWNAEQVKAEREAAYLATLPPPAPSQTVIKAGAKVRKTVKVVRPPTPEEIVRDVLESLISQVLSQVQQTQSSASGLEGCNSGAASPDARRELMAGDPQ
jgi:hypothetical protein